MSDGDARGVLGDLDATRWLFLLLALLLAGIHLSLGFVASVPAARETPYVVIGLVFLAGAVVAVTRYWEPILYLLGAGFATYVLVVWALSETVLYQIGLFTSVVEGAFVVLAVYLFVRDSAT